ncbi:protein of unknown function (DUF4303) [Brevibacterium sp. Mu109]|uniref:DUF4303 domain-containing protein n=1 Tax=Brevibacterium sp. Mu109 TaxID=1255669 RepID=UPI000C5D8A31|nr:DUF4303 domain-containing protein [Brevibacterium sp. Mu109]SMX89865.1 protein of unknown function (DUF4303) [Brevibacterium sp. Mu109]
MTLTATLRDSFAAGFTQLTDCHDRGEVVGYGVCSDGDAHSLYLAAHTRTARDEQIAEDPEGAVDYVWTSDEWDLPHEDDAAVDLVLAANHAVEALDISNIDARRGLVWTTVVDVMAQLVEEGFFERSPDAIRVVLVTDGVDEAAQVG